MQENEITVSIIIVGYIHQQAQSYSEQRKRVASFHGYQYTAS